MEDLLKDATALLEKLQAQIPKKQKDIIDNYKAASDEDKKVLNPYIHKLNGMLTKASKEGLSSDQGWMDFANEVKKDMSEH